MVSLLIKRRSLQILYLEAGPECVKGGPNRPDHDVVGVQRNVLVHVVHCDGNVGAVGNEVDQGDGRRAAAAIGPHRNLEYVLVGSSEFGRRHDPARHQQLAQSSVQLRLVERQIVPRNLSYIFFKTKN